MPLLCSAVECLAELLDSPETIGFLHAIEPKAPPSDLRLYHQDLRGLVRGLHEPDLIAIEEADPDTAAEILAIVGDFSGAIEDRQSVSAALAMVKLGGLLARGAQAAGITIPSTVFVSRPPLHVPRQAPEKPDAPWRGQLRRVIDTLSLPFDFVRLAWAAERGKPFMFDAPDDRSSPDRYPTGEPFGRRVFISFERSSVAIADRLEQALRRVGLEPYRYVPSKALASRKASYTLARFREENPGVGEEIVRTVRRSSAAVFVVTEAWTRSPVCQLEAWAARLSYFPFEAGRFALTELTQLPEELSGARPLTYRPGAEASLAREIAEDIDRLASFRNTAELRRRALDSK